MKLYRCDAPRLFLSSRSQASLLRLAAICVVVTPLWGQWQPFGATSGNIYYDNGNVGIGTTSPVARLNVNTSATGPGSGIASFGLVTSGSFGGGIGLQDGAGNIGIWDDTSGANLRFGFGTSLGALTPTVTFTSSGAVGIGTTSPGSTLEVDGENGGDGAITIVNWSGNVARVILDNFAPGGHSWDIRATDTTISPVGGFAISNNSAGTEPLTITYGGNVGIGITNPTSKLAVNGNISASEVVVTSAPSDYVFDAGYRLAPLSEVATYIKNNHHLPGIPAGPEVEEKGIGVGDMQSKLLAKVEELTLHMIQAEEQNTQLARQNAALKNEIQAIKEKLAR